MRLMELFSRQPDEDPRDQEIDWKRDLKFFIDNDEEMLSKHILPAIMKHKQNKDREDAYKIYLSPLKACAESYCNKYEDQLPSNTVITDKDIVELAKHMADIQKEFIDKGDYSNED